MRLSSITLVIAAGIKIATTDLTCLIIHVDNPSKHRRGANYLIRNLKNRVYYQNLKRDMGL